MPLNRHLSISIALLLVGHGGSVVKLGALCPEVGMSALAAISLFMASQNKQRRNLSALEMGCFPVHLRTCRLHPS